METQTKRIKSNYPKNKVYETESGHYKEYDDSGTGRIKESSKITYYEMTDEGIEIWGDMKVTIHGTAEVNVTAPLVNVNGDVVKLNS